MLQSTELLRATSVDGEVRLSNRSDRSVWEPRLDSHSMLKSYSKAQYPLSVESLWITTEQRFPTLKETLSLVLGA